MTADDAQRMVDVARDTGRHLMEAFMYRHHPTWVAALDLVASGRIGTLTAVQSWFSYFNDDAANIRNILEYGGGALFDIGCYSVNLSRMLFGGEPQRVAASLRRDPSSGVDVLTSAILDFEGGIATFTCSTRTETDQRVDIYGTTGRISIEIPFNIPPDRPTRVRVVAGGDPPVAPAIDVVEFPTADPYGVEFERFATAVLDGGPTPVPPEDAVANLRVIEAIFAAADQGTRSPVEIAQREGHRVLAAGRTDLAPLDVVAGHVDAHEQSRDPGLVGGVEVRRPLDRRVLRRSLLVEQLALGDGEARRDPPGSTASPVKAVMTSAAARLNVLWPDG